MALKFERLRDQNKEDDSMIANRRLYLNAARDKVVEEGDPEAAFLFATPGMVISDGDVRKYGLKARAKPEDKAIKKPAAKSVPDAKGKPKK